MISSTSSTYYKHLMSLDFSNLRSQLTNTMCLLLISRFQMNIVAKISIFFFQKEILKDKIGVKEKKKNKKDMKILSLVEQ